MTYTAINGQSLFDVCLNAYGTLDELYKLIQDSSISNVDQHVNTGLSFTYDPALVADQQINQITTLSGVIFATVPQNNGAAMYIIQGGNNNFIQNTPYTPPTMLSQYSYQRTSFTQYTASVDGETSISLPALVGKSILSVDKEIKYLFPAEYSWNAGTAILTLNSALAAGQTLFIFYQEMITVTP